MRVNSIQQNNTGFNGRFMFNTNIKNMVQKSEISEMVRFSDLLTRMAKIDDGKVFTLERKAMDGFYPHDGKKDLLNINIYSLCEQTGGEKKELSATVHATLGWINNALEKIYPVSSINVSQKALETEIFEKMSIMGFSKNL